MEQNLGNIAVTNQVANTMINSTRSKDKVKKHGEVFTPDSIVNDMLDLVDTELNKDDLYGYIDTTYLEPACGNGNFLLRIIDRKLNVVQKLPKEKQKAALIRAIASVYGIDIQTDNVNGSKKRIMQLIKSGSIEVLELPNKEVKEFNFEKFEIDEGTEKIIQFILDKNIICGNALTGKRCENNVEQDEDIIILEYKFDSNKLTTQQFRFNEIKNEHNEPLAGTKLECDYMQLPYKFVQYSDDTDYDF